MRTSIRRARHSAPRVPSAPRSPAAAVTPTLLGGAALAALALAALAAIAFAPAPASAAGSPVIVDERWTAPDFASRGIVKIAVLPAVTFDGFPPSHAVSNAFFNQFRTDGHRWLPPSSAYQRLGDTPPQRDSMLRAIGLQVRRDGHPERATAARIARRLEVDALVFLRVDRWEHLVQASEQTSIEVRAEMVDSAGAPLWRTAGRSRIFGETMRSEVVLPPAPQGNKLIETAMQAGGSGGSSSGSSSSGSGSGSAPTTGNASVSGSGGSSAPSGQSSAPVYITKIERRVTSSEDMMWLTGPDGPGSGPPAFDQAARALVEAWSPLLPHAVSAVPTRADSSAGKGEMRR